LSHPERLVLPLLPPRDLEFQPFREGVEIARLYGGAPAEPSAAFLRYAPGAKVPRHEHPGYEHIFVLEGSQEDERGRYEAGAFIVNPPGTSHTVWTIEGCLVLVIWQFPVIFSAPENAAERPGQ
jgi:anti-sigma factor ChrR (cupin superfamily)